MNLHFSTGKKINQYTFSELDKIQQTQFMLACKNAWGPQPSFFDAVRMSEKEQMTWEYYEVTNAATNQMEFQVWVLADDSATFFKANTTEEIEITMSQSSIYAYDDSNTALVELADVLKKGYRAAYEYDGDAFTAYWDDFYKKLDQDPHDKNYWINYFSQFGY